MILVSQVSRLVENYKVEIFSDTIHVINVELCMIVLPLNFTCLYHFHLP